MKNFAARTDGNREDASAGCGRRGGHKGARRGLKIDSSTVGMESARSYRASNTTMRRFTITDYREGLSQGNQALHAAIGGNTGNAGNAGSQGKNGKQGMGFSSQTMTTMEDWQARFQATSTRVTVRSSISQTYMEIQQQSIRYIFDMLFSFRRNRFGQWSKLGGYNSSQDLTSSVQNLVNQTNAATQNTAVTGSGAQSQTGNQNGNGSQEGNDLLSMGEGLFATNMKVLNYTQGTINIEAEDTAFSTVGTVHTSDGREIQFHVNVGMSRQLQQYYEENVELDAFTMCDPLVINLDTDVAQLSDQNFYFDIDGDGVLDEISQLGAGSGYLALDKNGDGKINDGNELFGTASGNGFKDLAQYDEDGNGWIDENDAIWSQLKIWCKDENGNDVLYKLADKGVGAICLQNVSTDFTMKGEDGRTKGAIRNSGVFLYENGNVGTVQHVDVAKYDKGA